MHQQPGQELSGVEGLCAGPPGSLVPVSSDGSIEVEAFEGQWGPQEISCEVLETGTVFGRSRDPVVSRETGVGKSWTHPKTQPQQPRRRLASLLKPFIVDSTGGAPPAITSIALRGLVISS
jgi:hypothetical protein